jgi:hypothetical protein
MTKRRYSSFSVPPDGTVQTRNEKGIQSMSVSIKGVSLAILAIGLQMSATPVMAGKEKFERTKPHVNVGTLGSTNSGPTSAASGFQQGGQGAKKIPAVRARIRST